MFSRLSAWLSLRIFKAFWVVTLFRGHWWIEQSLLSLRHLCPSPAASPRLTIYVWPFEIEKAKSKATNAPTGWCFTRQRRSIGVTATHTISSNIHKTTYIFWLQLTSNGDNGGMTLIYLHRLPTVNFFYYCTWSIYHECKNKHRSFFMHIYFMTENRVLFRHPIAKKQIFFITFIFLLLRTGEKLQHWNKLSY